jgi:hypothetical protein
MRLANKLLYMPFLAAALLIGCERDRTETYDPVVETDETFRTERTAPPVTQRDEPAQPGVYRTDQPGQRTEPGRYQTGEYQTSERADQFETEEAPSEFSRELERMNQQIEQEARETTDRLVQSGAQEWEQRLIAVERRLSELEVQVEQAGANVDDDTRQELQEIEREALSVRADIDAFGRQTGEQAEEVSEEISDALADLENRLEELERNI